MSFDILERNLAALRVRQPEVAAIIQGCELPEGMVPTLGRDGTPTLMFPGKDGLVWLGGSSMPRASAEEMFGHVDPRGGSVTLPAMLTGLEVIVLVERLAAPFAVFVVDEPRAFKTVLWLRDYASHFEAGRIVLLVSDNLPARAREFFTRNSGFVMPAHMFKVPQLSAGHLANLARSLEDAGTRAITVQNEIVAASVGRLTNAETTVLPDAPSVAILAADNSDTTIENARRLERGLDAFATTCTVCLPTNPEKCHVVARVAAVEQVRPNLIVYTNGITDPERALYPNTLPVMDWLPNGGVVRRRAGGGPFDMVVTASRTHYDQVLGNGVARDRILLLEPAADVLEGDTVDEVRSVDEESPVAVVMDLPDDRPEALGLNLPSHIALYKALQQEVLRRSDLYIPSDASKIFQAAQQSSGTLLTDSALAASFESWLHSHIAPATVARSLALALVKNGFQPEIWGSNWPAMGRGRDLRRGAIPSGIGAQKMFDRPAWVVIPWFSHEGVQFAVDVMARGSVVIMHGPRQSFIADYPGLAELSESIQWFQTAAELVATLRRLISRHEAAAEKARIVARRIRAEHTIPHRLQTLIQHVRALQVKLCHKGAGDVERL